jgi:hypothetical protein
VDPDTEAASGPSPIARWNSPDRGNAHLIWWAQLDDRYLVEVIRATQIDEAEIRVWDHDAALALIHRQRVGLVDNAEFGPAIEDVVAWQRAAVAAVDGRARKKGTNNGKQTR